MRPDNLPLKDIQKNVTGLLLEQIKQTDESTNQNAALFPAIPAAH